VIHPSSPTSQRHRPSWCARAERPYWTGTVTRRTVAAGSRIRWADGTFAETGLRLGYYCYVT